MKRFIVVFLLFNALSVYANSYELGTEFFVSENNPVSDWQLEPVTASAGNSVMTVWKEEDTNIYANFLGIGDDSKIQLNTTTVPSPTEYYYSVASNGSNYFATWVGETGETDTYIGDILGYYGRFFDSSGNAIGSTIRLDSATSGNANWGAGSFTMASDGDNYLLTHKFLKLDETDFSWETTLRGVVIDGDTHDVSRSEYTVLNDNQYANYTMGAMASNGNNYLMTWESDSSYDIYGMYFDNAGDLISSQYMINDYTTSFQAESSISSDGVNYMIAWNSNEQDGDAYGVFVRVFDNDGDALTDEIQINSHTLDNQISASVASSGDEYLISYISWNQDGDDDGIFARFVDNEGNYLGDEFMVNQFTTDYQRKPSVAYDGNDYFIAWQSSTLTSSNWGIKGIYLEGQEDVIPEPTSIILVAIALSGLRFFKKKKS